MYLGSIKVGFLILEYVLSVNKQISDAISLAQKLEPTTSTFLSLNHKMYQINNNQYDIISCLSNNLEIKL
jgi:hypothetical protein